MPKSLWPHQQRILEQTDRYHREGCNAQLVVSATGTGKSRVMFELLLGAAKRRIPAIVYCNRRLLYDQLRQGLFDVGISHGCRAAGHRSNLTRDIQLAMVQTERSKVLQDSVRELHHAKLVLVDEAHLMGNGASLTIVRKHLADGAHVIGFSATPVDLGHLYGVLIQGAQPSEGRECGALVAARCYGPDVPDQKFIKNIKAGNEVIDGKWTTIWLKSIFGRIEYHWRKLNPERRPTILFAPGVKESLWLAKDLHARGIRSAHIDAKGTWADGEWTPGSAKRDEIIERLRSGNLEILCNRFVLREGIDIPELYHCILATKFGSETTFLQAVGRVLRNHRSLPGHVIIQDHGANFLHHGSPNMDRTWLLTDTTTAREYIRREMLRRDEIAEPYTCPRCSGLRSSGGRCPYCGYVCDQRVRQVVQADGSLKEASGKMFRQRPRAQDTLQGLWERCYWAAYKNNRTFAQAFAAFGYRCSEKHGYYAVPNREWPLMPTRIVDEVRRVCDVPRDKLIPKGEMNADHQDHGRKTSRVHA